MDRVLRSVKNFLFSAPVLVLLAFFLPRLAFFEFVSQHPSILAPFSLEPSTGKDGSLQGKWIEYAQQMDQGILTVNYDDMGVPQLLRGLHQLGFNYDIAFSIFLYGMLAVGGVMVWFWHRTLIKEMGLTAATWISIGLVLYPRGVYFSRQFTIFLLPVYACLLSLLVIKNSDALFRKLNLTKIALSIGSAVLLSFLCLARSPCQAIGAALLTGLVVKGGWKKESRRGFLIFLGSILLFFTLFKILTPPSGHTFWHPVYRGLSNFDNRFNIEPSDDGMIALARQENPTLTGADIWSDPEYEKTFRRLTLNLIAAHPLWYLKVLSLRAVHLIVLPRSGGWLPRLEGSILDQPYVFRDLISGSQYLAVRLYISLYNLSVGLDMGIILLGFIGLVLSIRHSRLKESLPFGLLLFSVLYIYIPIDSHYRDVYMAGTYIYLYFALRLIGKWISRPGILALFSWRHT